MTSADDDPEIGSLDELLAALELDGADELLELIENDFEPLCYAVQLDGPADEERLRIVVLHSLGVDHAQFDLPYPFRLSQWRQQWNWLMNFQGFNEFAIEATNEDATLGAPGTQYDATSWLAQAYGIAVDELLELLGRQSWVRWLAGSLPRWDLYGKSILGWFVEEREAETPTWAFGFGGNAIYLEKVAYDDAGVPSLAEMPEPLWVGRYYETYFEDVAEETLPDPFTTMVREWKAKRPARKVVSPRSRLDAHLKES